MKKVLSFKGKNDLDTVQNEMIVVLDLLGNVIAQNAFQSGYESILPMDIEIDSRPDKLIKVST